MTTLQIIGFIVVALLGLYVFYCIYDLGRRQKSEDRRKNKNKALTMALLIVTLFAGLNASAQNGGLFGKGPNRGYDNEYYDDYGTRDGVFGFSLPSSHGQTNDEPAPLGGGALLLIGFGAAYASLRRKNQK